MALCLNKEKILFYEVKKFFGHFSKKKIPLIFFDADGVLRLGNTGVPQAKETIKLLRKLKLPFRIVTNGCGDTEKAKAYQFSRNIGLPKKYELKEKEVILSHTPMKIPLRKASKEDFHKFPLIVGHGKMHDIMKSYGIKRYITDIEYATIFSHIIPANWARPLFKDKKKARTIKERVQRRLKVDLSHPLCINSIFQVADVLRWEIPLQLCCDILISKDGVPGTERSSDEEQKIMYHIANADMDYMDIFTLPRFCGGSFFLSMNHLYKMKYGKDIKLLVYGKPSKLVFDYARKSTGIKNVSNCYMIGDNPNVDIKGANNAGIFSILVRTGMFKGENDKDNPAKKVVDNCYDALKFILKKERILL